MVVDGVFGGVVFDIFVGGVVLGVLVIEFVGFRGGFIVDVGVGFIGFEFGFGIGLGFSLDLGFGFGGEFYFNGFCFGDGLDVMFVEFFFVGGFLIGFFGLGFLLDGEFGYVEGVGVGGCWSDLVSIWYMERVVLVLLMGGVFF